MKVGPFSSTGVVRGKVAGISDSPNLDPLPKKAFSHQDIWRIPGPPDRVYSVLRNVAAWNGWWPGMHSASSPSGGFDIEGGEFAHFRVHVINTTDDPEHRFLQADLSGGITGAWRWRVNPDGHRGSVVIFEESADTPHHWLNATWNLPAHLVGNINHQLFMRKGQQGLRALFGG